jgi:ketosteroid isomerase-like protein
MGTDTRQVVMKFFDDTMSGGLGLAARNHAADDVIWWLPASTRDDAFRSKDEVIAWFDTRSLHMFEVIPEMVVEHVVVEGNVAAAQLRAKGLTKAGKHYDNRYIFMMTVDDGKIIEMREFFDTKHVQETLH